jgi:hypothetical protein
MTAPQRVGNNYSTWWGAETQVDGQGNESISATQPEGPRPARAAETNGQRTLARPASPYAEMNVTPSGDSIYLAGAAIKGRDSNSGIEVEVFTASAQLGGQMEAQLGAARIGASDDDGASSIGVDVFTARAAMGVHNADGSLGWNAGATAVAVGAEGTVQFGSASSLTAGASVGVGFEGSIGLRDADGDNQPELCGRAVVGWATLGLCLEMPFEAPGLSRADRTDGK